MHERHAPPTRSRGAVTLEALNLGAGAEHLVAGPRKPLPASAGKLRFCGMLSNVSITRK